MSNGNPLRPGWPAHLASTTVSTDLDAILAEATERVAETTDLDALGRLRGDFLGKKSALTAIKATMGQLEPAERKTLGQAMGATRAGIEAAFAAKTEELEAMARRARLEAERLDLTERTTRGRLGHLHVVTQAMERLEDVFCGMGYVVEEGPEVEDEWHNFEALNIPDWHPARGMQDSLFVDMNEPESTLLRTHTSPVQIRTMQNQEPPIYMVCPGRVYRRDAADSTHMPVFHQIECLAVDEGLTFADLAGTIDAFTKSFFGEDIETRLRPSYFPFTEPSAEFDISTPSGDWLELGGSGMVHPNVLRNCGIDPERYTGFAFGFGIDRLALMRHQIDDLRELFTNDVRFLRQF